MIFIREGILKWDNVGQTPEDNFDTDAYLANQYEGLVKNDLVDLDPSKGDNATIKVKMEDGILLPRYRLPTEAEWEFAALGLIGNSNDELITERRIYPWNGHIVRNADDRYKGQLMANLKRGRGDNMGVAGKLNDNADVTAEVYAYWPNDYGLYNMSGNVAEWVMDVYRPLSFEDMTDFRPFRGNVYKTVKRDDDFLIAEKDSFGKIEFRDVTEAESEGRRNYRKADNINYNDGDRNSSTQFSSEDDQMDPDEAAKMMYEFGATSMINDKSRVYKGGSWKDRYYYASPGTRRFLDERLSTDYIGFRCAMVRVGSPVGLGGKKRK
jgi:gliding motility-associated lipoprotein GldJ